MSIFLRSLRNALFLSVIAPWAFVAARVAPSWTLLAAGALMTYALIDALRLVSEQ